jgi:PIN domain nuclease of toxin-antitoxin system
VSAVLLDTHVLIWSLFDRPELTASARGWMEDASTIYVSVVSIYEIDFKRRRGGLRAKDSFLQRMPQNMPETLPSFGFRIVDISAEIAWRAARLPIDHPDPWDRILVAQAMALDAPLISNDKPLRASVDGQPKTRGVIVF